MKITRKKNPENIGRLESIKNTKIVFQFYLKSVTNKRFTLLYINSSY